MIYTIFMKNEKHNLPPSPTAIVVTAFVRAFASTDITICLPGYMSTTQNTIHKFVNQIKLGPYTYFSRGMNGKKPLSPYINVQDKYNSYYKGIPFTFFEDTDHSKMIFFIDNQFGEFDLSDENICNSIFLRNTIGQPRIKAVLIGSSNQSQQTYFNKAQKGEADILLIDGDIIDTDDTNVVEPKILEMFRTLPDSIRKNIIISKELKDCTNKYLLEDIFNKAIKDIQIK